MRRIGLFIPLILALCSGQFCPGPSQSPSGPPPADLIPEGSYTGDVTCQTTVSVIPFTGSPPATISDTSTVTREFDANGILLFDSAPLAPGTQRGSEIGRGTRLSTVQEVTAGGGQLVIRSQERLTFLDPLGTLIFVGNSEEIYTLQPDFTVRYEEDLTTTNLGGTSQLRRYTLSCSGVLAK